MMAQRAPATAAALLGGTSRSCASIQHQPNGLFVCSRARAWVRACMRAEKVVAMTDMSRFVRQIGAGKFVAKDHVDDDGSESPITPMAPKVSNGNTPAVPSTPAQGAPVLLTPPRSATVNAEKTQPALMTQMRQTDDAQQQADWTQWLARSSPRGRQDEVQCAVHI